jgi:uncharacterized membrane protein YbhN (UPF0104 family)
MSVETASAPTPPVHWLRGVALFIAAGVALYLGAVVLAGADESLGAIVSLGPGVVASGVALASSAYLVRFARWHWMFDRLGHRLPAVFNLRVYLAGLALTSSPGKLGEAIRSVLLLRARVPVPDSFAAFVADRGADVLGVALLGAVAAWAGGTRELLLEALAIGGFVVTGAVAVTVRRGRFAIALQSRGGRGGWTARLAAPLPRWALLWTPARSASFSLLAFAAYGCQALVFAGYVSVLGGGVAVADCVRIFAVSMLLGAASMVPGGLGATEAALVYQLHSLGVPSPQAVAAAIALRLSTLWVAILLGVVALWSFAGRSGSVE